MGILSSNRNLGKASQLYEFTQGIEVDSRLAEHEVAVQKAWARALGTVGALTVGEAEQARSSLDEALELMKSGKFDWRTEDEDIHMNLERFVTDRHGALGKKMHLGRSRNDLIATTLRLSVAESLRQTQVSLSSLLLALCEKAEQVLDLIVPGSTHLQHGQPVRLGHVLAAHGWAFERDLARVASAVKQALSVMPLGSAALSGTTLPVDLDEVARVLGFVSGPLNSYDSVGDRDFIVEALDAWASIGIHLSRLSEDLIFWSSTPVGLLRLPPAWSTGSSIMPNKRNPDVPELIRGKSAHLLAAATESHALLKGLPTSYDSDLHELKSVYLRAFDESDQCLSVLPHFIQGCEFNAERAAQLLKQGHILATEVADELASQGVPFREAYAQVAALVELAESKSVQIEDLKQADWRGIAPLLPREFMSRLSATCAVERRNQAGGTSRARALSGIRVLRSRCQ